MYPDYVYLFYTHHLVITKSHIKNDNKKKCDDFKKKEQDILYSNFRENKHIIYFLDFMLIPLKSLKLTHFISI
jgi:hypothetical protein